MLIGHFFVINLYIFQFLISMNKIIFKLEMLITIQPQFYYFYSQL